MKNTFHDNKGRAWSIDITVGSIKRVQKRLAGSYSFTVNLANLMEGDQPLATRLRTDIPLLVDVLWVLVEGQNPGVDDVQFGEGLGGEGLAEAAEAFWEQVESFFRSLGQIEMVGAIRKASEVLQKGRERVLAETNKVDVAKLLDQAITARTAALSATPGNSAGTTLASSE